MPTVFESAAAISGRRTTCAKCTEPISSSPSPTSTRLTGGFRPAPRSAWSAARKVASGPFWFTAPRPTTTLPNPGLSTRRASHGGDDHSRGSTCFTSYMKYRPTVLGAPASSVANTPGNPSVGTFSARWNPASRSMRRKSWTPSSPPMPSAAMVGWWIHSWSRCTASPWRRSISRSTGPRSAARDKRGSSSEAAPAREPRSIVRRERLSIRFPHQSRSVVSSTNATQVSCEAIYRPPSVGRSRGALARNPIFANSRGDHEKTSEEEDRRVSLPWARRRRRRCFRCRRVPSVLGTVGPHPGPHRHGARRRPDRLEHPREHRLRPVHLQGAVGADHHGRSARALPDTAHRRERRLHGVQDRPVLELQGLAGADLVRGEVQLGERPAGAAVEPPQ